MYKVLAWFTVIEDLISFLAEDLAYIHDDSNKASSPSVVKIGDKEVADTPLYTI